MPLPRHLPRVLTLSDIADLGLTESAVRHAARRHGWQRMTRGVLYTRPDPPTRDDWALAGLAVAGKSGAVSGWDAVRTRGLGNATPPDGRVLVLCRRGKHRWADGFVVRPTVRPYVSTTLPIDHPTMAFAPIVLPPRAVADTALACADFDTVRALVTSSIQRRLCTPQALLRELESGPRNRSRQLRRALADILVNAHSIAEAEAADLLRAARVPTFELNVDIVDRRSGRRVGTADVLWRRLRAVGEVQSRAFHFEESSWEATMDRQNRLGRYSLAVQGWSPTTIRRGLTWASEVAAWLQARCAELGVPYVAGDGAVVVGPDGPPPFLVG